jgi:cytochrome c-type biogenesis protein CcmE
MKRKYQRIYMILGGLVAVAVGAAMVLLAFEDSVVFFYSPSDIKENRVDVNQRIRVGGLVEIDSVKKKGTQVTFNVTDTVERLEVTFTGILPDLFREGQGIIAEGKLIKTGGFIASEVLAKHDENYMPPEVADAIKKAGQWKESNSNITVSETAE